MPCFVKSVRNEWDSKLDMLSMAVSAEIGGEYWRPGTTAPLVAQAADGMLDVPSGVMPMCVIYHDALDYPETGAVMSVAICPREGVRFVLASYPLRAEDMCRLPVSVEFDAVIGGKVPAGSEVSVEGALTRASLGGKRVAIAVTGAMDGDGVKSMLERISPPASVEVLSSPELPVTAALYRTCATVVHLGDCSRGYLHSMAEFHAGVDGRTLVERVPGPKFVPSTLPDLMQILKR